MATEVQNNIIGVEKATTDLTNALKPHVEMLGKTVQMYTQWNAQLTKIPSEYLNNLNNMAAANEKVANSNKKVVDATINVNKAVQQRLNTGASLYKQQQKEEASEKRMNEARDRAAKKILEQNRAYNRLYSTWKEAQKALKDSIVTDGLKAESTRKLQKEFEILDARIRKVQNAAKDYSLEIGNYKSVFRGVGNLASQFAGALGWVGGIGAAVAIAKSFKDVLFEFDSGLLNVSKTTGISNNELKNLGVSIRLLSKELEVVPINNLLEYATVAGQLGVKGTDNILKFTKALAMLETASNIKGEEGGAEIARLLTLVDGGVQNVEQFGDEIVKLGNNFAATESEILSNATAIAQNTGVYKLGRQEVLAYGTATKAVGIEAEITGSSIGRVLAELENSIRTGENISTVMKLTKKSAAELKDEFKTDAGSVLYSFVKGLNEIDKSGGSVLGTLDSIGVTAIRDKRVIASLATGGYDVLTNALKDVQDASGAMSKEFETASGKLQNNFNAMKVAWDNFILSVNSSENAIGRFASQWMEGATIIIQWIERISTSWRELNKLAGIKGNEAGFNEVMTKDKNISPEEAIKKAYEAEKTIRTLSRRQQELQQELKTSSDFIGSWNWFAGKRSTPAINKDLEKVSAELGKVNGRLRAYRDIASGIKSENTDIPNIIGAGNMEETDKERKKRLAEEKKARETDLKDAEKQRLEYLQRDYKIADQLIQNELKVTKNFQDQIELRRKAAALWFLNELSKTKGTNQELLLLNAQFTGKMKDLDNEELKNKEKNSEKKKRLENEISKIWKKTTDEVNKIIEDSNKKAIESEQKRVQILKENLSSILSGSFDNLGFGSLSALFDEQLIEMWKTTDSTTAKMAIAFQVFGNVVNDVFSKMKASSDRYYENEYSKLEAEKEIALKYASENAEGREDIERQYDERRKQIKREQAKQEKEMALFQALINVATGVTAALAQGPTGIPLAIVIGALGALEIASIASRELPQFWKGTQNAPEGWAIVDELRPEIHTDKKGNIKSTGSNKGANLRFLEKGDKIFPSHDAYFREMNSQLNMSGSFVDRNGSIHIDNSGITASEMESIMQRTIGSQPTEQTVIDERGFNTFVINGTNRTRRANKRTKFGK